MSAEAQPLECGCHAGLVRGVAGSMPVSAEDPSRAGPAAARSRHGRAKDDESKESLLVFPTFKLLARAKGLARLLLHVRACLREECVLY